LPIYLRGVIKIRKKWRYKMDFKLSENAKNVLLELAKKSVENRLVGKKSIEIGDLPDELKFDSGCFVTIHKGGRLRGCIGNFRDDVNILKNVAEMAQSAAFSDPRFAPVVQEEFSQLKFEISVLSPMTEIEDVETITVGRDGLYIIKGFNSGVLLPQVAVEHKWDKYTFLSQTCLKAGLAENAWESENTRIFRFEALIFGDAQ